VSGGASGSGGAAGREPVQEFFSIGEVCELTGLKPHVLRYWESQFRFLNPAKNRSGNRVYQRKEVETILLVKQLLYTEKYTIEGARQKVEEARKGGELRQAARGALHLETLVGLEDELRQLLRYIETGERPADELPDDAAANGAGRRTRGGTADGAVAATAAGGAGAEAGSHR